MRIAHRDWDSVHVSGGKLYGQFRPYSGFAHFDLKLVFGFSSLRQHTSLQSGTGLYGNSLFLLGCANVSCDTARAVTGNLRYRTISVDQTNLHIGRWVGIHPLHSIRADAFVPIADPPGERRCIQIGFEKGSVDQQKVIAACAGLHKRNYRGRKAHSNSTGPREATLPSTVDAFSSRRKLFCSRLHPATSNCRRMCWPVLPLKTFCIMRWRCSRMRLISCVISSTLPPVTSSQMSS